jgi:mannosyltransferase OCH1-like enzyme
MIPKTIHQIWWGYMPTNLQAHVMSWRRMAQLHGWEHRLWTLDDIKQLKLTNEAFFNKDWHITHKTDVARMEIMERFGGLYVDCDYHWAHQDPENYLHRDKGLPVVTLEHQIVVPKADWYPSNPTRVSNAITFRNSIFAFPPKHPWMVDMVRLLPEHIQKNRNCPGITLTGIGYWQITWKYPVIVLPTCMTCSYPNNEEWPFFCYSEGKWHQNIPDYERVRLLRCKDYWKPPEGLTFKDIPNTV